MDYSKDVATLIWYTIHSALSVLHPADLAPELQKSKLKCIHVCIALCFLSVCADTKENSLKGLTAVKKHNVNEPWITGSTVRFAGILHVSSPLVSSY